MSSNTPVPYIGDRVQSFDTLADAAAAPLQHGQQVTTQGRVSLNDGGGNSYRFNEGPIPVLDDGGFFIEATGGYLEAIDKSVANVLQFGATGNGTTDDYATINKAIYSGASKVVLPDKTYLTNQTFELNGLTDLEIVIEGTLVRNPTTWTPGTNDVLIYLGSCHRVSITGMRGNWAFDGSAAAGTSALRGVSCSKCTVSNCGIDNMGASGVIFADGTGNTVKGLRVNNIHQDGSSSGAVAIVSNSDFTVDDIQCTEMSGKGVAITGTCSGSVSNISHINTTYGSAADTVLYVSADGPVVCNNITTLNTFIKTSQFTLDCAINNAQVVTDGYWAFYNQGGTNVRVSNSRFVRTASIGAGNPTAGAVYLHYHTDAVNNKARKTKFTNCVFESAADMTAYIFEAEDIEFNNCTFLGTQAVANISNGGQMVRYQGAYNLKFNNCTLHYQGTENVATVDGYANLADSIVEFNDTDILNDASDAMLTRERTATVTLDSTSDLVLATNHTYREGQSGRLTATTSLPPELTDNISYYVVNVLADSFQIATSPGGMPISFSNNGSGIIQWHTSQDVSLQGGTIKTTGTTKVGLRCFGAFHSSGTNFVSETYRGLELSRARSRIEGGVIQGATDFACVMLDALVEDTLFRGVRFYAPNGRAHYYTNSITNRFLDCFYDVAVESNTQGSDGTASPGTPQEINNKYPSTIDFSAEAIQSFETVADAIAAILQDGQQITTQGYNTKHDGGGNTYRFNSGLIPIPHPGDGGFIIAANGGWLEAIDQTVARPKQFGAVADGTTDDRDIVQACLDAAVSNDSIVDLDNYTYGIGSQLSLTGVTNLTILGPGTLKALPPRFENAILLLTTCTGIKFQGVTFDTNKPAMVQFAPGDYGTWYCAGVYGVTNSGDFNFQDCHFKNLYTAHILMVGGIGSLVVNNCTFDSPDQDNRSQCEFISVNNLVGRVDITNNSFVQESPDPVENACAITTSAVTGPTTITRNLFDGVGRDNTGSHRLTAIDFYSATDNVVVAHNTAVNLPYAFFRSVSGNNLVFESNIIHNVTPPADQACVLINNTSGATIENLRVLNNVIRSDDTVAVGGQGISLAGTTWSSVFKDVHVVGNTVESFREGIITQGSFDGWLFRDNTIRSRARGIYWQSTNVTGDETVDGVIRDLEVSNNTCYVEAAALSFPFLSTTADLGGRFLFDKNHLEISGTGAGINCNNVDHEMYFNDIYNAIQGLYPRGAITYTIGGNRFFNCTDDIFDQGDPVGAVYTIPFSGSGSPEGVVTARPGAQYLNTDGGAGTTLWTKESGVNTNTGWVPTPVTAVQPEQFGAVADGTTDDTAAIQAAIDTGLSVELPQSYGVSAPIICNNAEQRIYGKGKVIELTAEPLKQTFDVTADNVTIEDIEIVGSLDITYWNANLGGTIGSGVDWRDRFTAIYGVSTSVGLKVNNVTIRGKQIGVVTDLNHNDASITNTRFWGVFTSDPDGAGNLHMFISNEGKRTVVQSNKVQDCSSIITSGAGSGWCTIGGNTMLNSWDNGIYCSTSSYDTIVNNVIDMNITASGRTGSGIKCRGNNYTITGNSISNCGVGIALTANTGVTESEFKRTHLKFNTGSVKPNEGEILTGGTGASVATVLRVYQQGGSWGAGDAYGYVEIRPTTENGWSDSEALTGDQGAALTNEDYLVGGQGNVISSNTVYKTTGIGISVENDSSGGDDYWLVDTVIENNNLMFCGNDGNRAIRDNCHRTHVRGNMISGIFEGSPLAGIDCSFGVSKLIESNTVDYPQNCMRLDQAPGVVIRGNIFTGPMAFNAWSYDAIVEDNIFNGEVRTHPGQVTFRNNRCGYVLMASEVNPVADKTGYFTFEGNTLLGTSNVGMRWQPNGGTWGIVKINNNRIENVAANTYAFLGSNSEACTIDYFEFNDNRVRNGSASGVAAVRIVQGDPNFLTINRAEIHNNDIQSVRFGLHVFVQPSGIFNATGNRVIKTRADGGELAMAVTGFAEQNYYRCTMGNPGGGASVQLLPTGPLKLVDCYFPDVRTWVIDDKVTDITLVDPKYSGTYTELDIGTATGELRESRFGSNGDQIKLAAESLSFSATTGNFIFSNDGGDQLLIAPSQYRLETNDGMNINMQSGLFQIAAGLFFSVTSGSITLTSNNGNISLSTPVTGALIPPGGPEPSLEVTSPLESMIKWDQTRKVLMIYNGTVWQDIATV